MSKQWQPKKIREFSYPENASKIVDEWFINYASLQKISKETGIARTTLYRWKREMVKNNQSLQEFISVVNYKKCVDLEISDWKEFTKKKEEAKKIDSA
ncbi:hypothetical protein, partial [Lactobacillus sp. PSON]|uniref:hypothetical protein n=1 Tax=Lactobacillus sp. PSON TaxID=3455454 RepID=UPI0040431B40